jgi:hypothetical protein
MGCEYNAISLDYHMLTLYGHLIYACEATSTTAPGSTLLELAITTWLSDNDGSSSSHVLLE